MRGLLAWALVGLMALPALGLVACGCSGVNKAQRGHQIGDPNMPPPPPDGGERREPDDTAE